MTGQNEFRLVQEDGHRERTLIEGESLDDVLEQASEKAGRGGFWEALEDL